MVLLREVQNCVRALENLRLQCCLVKRYVTIEPSEEFPILTIDQLVEQIDDLRRDFLVLSSELSYYGPRLHRSNREDFQQYYSRLVQILPQVIRMSRNVVEKVTVEDQFA